MFPFWFSVIGVYERVIRGCRISPFRANLIKGIAHKKI